MNQAVFITIWLVLAPLLWFAIGYFAAHLGGWAALAREFRMDRRPEGRTYHFCSGSVGLANYSFCLTICLTDRGLYLAVLLPFRVGHPPLLIPWEEFHSTRRRRLFFATFTETCIGTPVIASLALPRWLVDCISEQQARVASTRPTEEWRGEPEADAAGLYDSVSRDAGDWLDDAR